MAEPLTRSGGRALVNGTSYDIGNGKTIIDGTSYDIPFKKIDWVEILNTSNYSSASGEATLTCTIPSGTIAIAAQVCNSAGRGDEYQPSFMYFINGNTGKLKSSGNYSSVNNLSVSGSTLTVTYYRYSSTYNYIGVYALIGKGSWHSGSISIRKSNVADIALPETWKFFVAGDISYTFANAEALQTLDAMAGRNLGYCGAYAHCLGETFASYPYASGDRALISVDDGYVFSAWVGSQACTSFYTGVSYFITNTNVIIRNNNDATAVFAYYYYA